MDAAAALHREDATCTLLTALDLPWVADGLQRDGAHVQAPVDSSLRGLMRDQGIAFELIAGQGERRLAQAMAALAPKLRNLRRRPSQGNAGPPQVFLTPAGGGLGAARSWGCS